jgi:hypothetical protein
MLAGVAQKVKRRPTHEAEERGRLLYAAGTAVKLRLKPFMRHAAPTTDEKG